MATDARAFYSAHSHSVSASGTKTLGLVWIVYGVLRLAAKVHSERNMNQVPGCRRCSSNGLVR